MSYSICRIAKIKASGVTGIQIHDRREKDGISHTNEDIDWTKTSENIDLLEQQERFRTVVNNRIAELELKRAPRSDATVMCQCLVTSDKAFFDKMSREEQNEYFKKSFEFIKERYGEKNLVSATIHYDERTPHMHVNFVPVTEDGRLSAKDLFSPKSLRVLQDDYNRFVREHGYDLERGQIDSKTKHLEVEEYKVETRYKELKAKEQTLERLEQIDTKVGLQAEKGKIAYSTKEVDAIKEQNKALKLESSRKDGTIRGLENQLDRAEKRLSQAQKSLEGTEILLDRLKDLESENRALEFLRKNHPQLDKALEQYDTMKKQAYEFGQKLTECKEVYKNCVAERERLIQRSGNLEKSAQRCGEQIKDVQRVQGEIRQSLAQETALKSELGGLNGFFKKKAREDCQRRLEEQESHTGKLESYLKREHNTDYQHIPEKIQEYSAQAYGFRADAMKCKEMTDTMEQNRDNAVHMYKFYKGVSDTQQVDMREITERINAKVTLRPGEEKLFRLTQADRTQLLKEYEGKVAPKTIEKCRGNFERQNVQEQKAREVAKVQVKEKSHSRGWSHER